MRVADYYMILPILPLRRQFPQRERKADVRQAAEDRTAGQRSIAQLDRVVLLSALHDIAPDPERPEFWEVRRLRGFSDPTPDPTSARPSPPARRTVTRA
jgi:hypothetical protein